MSSPYRIKLKESVTETVRDSDKTTQKINLENIVSEDDMRSLLKENLKKEGFKETSGNKLVKKRETGEVQTVDLANLEVTTELEVHKQVKVEREVTVKGRDADRMSRTEKRDFDKKAKSDLLGKLEKEAKTEARKQQAALAKLIADTLAKSEEERRTELNRAVKETYKDAIKKKAASMGNVTSIEERGGGEDYEMVIRISE